MIGPEENKLEGIEPEWIKLEGIEKSYLLGGERIYALQQVYLTIGCGDYVALTGPSGSGKSTLLNMLGLLDRPDRGCYRLNGVVTQTLPEEARAQLRRRQIGFIFQSFQLIPRLTAYENVELPLMLAEVPRRERRSRIESVLAQVGLEKQANQRPHQLSGGQMQRVAIARAIAMSPPLLLADEPTGNLDQHAGQGVVELLEGLNEQGMTVVLVTHNQELARRAKRQLTLVDGGIVGDLSYATA